MPFRAFSKRRTHEKTIHTIHTSSQQWELGRVGSQSRQLVTILRYTLRSDIPNKLNSDNQRDSVTENPLLQTPTLLFVSVF